MREEDTASKARATPSKDAYIATKMDEALKRTVSDILFKFSFHLTGLPVLFLVPKVSYIVHQRRGLQ